MRKRERERERERERDRERELPQDLEGFVAPAVDLAAVRWGLTGLCCRGCCWSASFPEEYRGSMCLALSASKEAS